MAPATFPIVQEIQILKVCHGRTAARQQGFRRWQYGAKGTLIEVNDIELDMTLCVRSPAMKFSSSGYPSRGVRSGAIGVSPSSKWRVKGKARAHANREQSGSPVQTYGKAWFQAKDLKARFEGKASFVKSEPSPCLEQHSKQSKFFFKQLFLRE